MAKLIKISLNEEWVLAQQDADVLPIDAICNMLTAKFSVADFQERSFSTLYFVVDDDKTEKASEEIKNVLKVEFAAEKLGEILTLEVEEATEDDDEDFDPEEVLEKLFGDDFFDDEPVLKTTTKTEEKKEEPKEEPKVEEPKKAEDLPSYKKIMDLIGCEEFKKLAKELVTIAPQIKKNRTFEVINKQSYIFSINDGCGCSTYQYLVNMSIFG